MSEATATALTIRNVPFPESEKSVNTGLRPELGDLVARLSEIAVAHGLAPRVEGRLREASEAIRRFQPSAMVFGLYNAGKSTLLNALLGRASAKVSDAPCTSSVDAYAFGDWTIFDTPGIDAPIIHETVTRDHLRRCHVVIVVISTAGSTEEDRTIGELTRLQATDKELIVVLNNKSGTVDQAELARIREKLERVAFGAGETDRKVPVILVNAATAVRAREQGKEKLYELSGVPDLAMLLPAALERAGGDRVLLPAFDLLSTVIGMLRTELGEVGLSAEEERFRELLKRVRAARAEFHRLMAADLAGLRGALANRLETAIRNRADQGPALSWYLEQVDGSVTRHLDLLFAELGESFPELERPAVASSTGMDTDPASPIPEDEPAQALQATGPRGPVNLPIDPKVLPSLVRGPEAQAVTREGLLFLRSMGVPGVKGRWARTLDRWAGNICRGVGVFLEVGIAWWQWQEASRAQAAFEASQADARRRLRRSAEELASNCETEVLNQLGEIGRQAFAPLEDRLERELLGARITLDRRTRDLIVLDGLEERVRGLRPGR